MKSFAIMSIIGLAAAAANANPEPVAAPQPVVTARAELVQRQNNNPALLGWISGSGSVFSDQRTCDSPATLSSSASLAQCCVSNSECTFWSSCSAGTLFAGSTSLRCDNGYCNTALIVPTVGATSGVRNLGCWATSLGSTEFTIVRDIGTATAAASARASASSAARSAASAASSAAVSATSAADSTVASASASASASAKTGGAALVESWGGVAGLAAMILGLI